jgi:hypothetical protein
MALTVIVNRSVATMFRNPIRRLAACSMSVALAACATSDHSGGSSAVQSPQLGTASPTGALATASASSEAPANGLIAFDRNGGAALFTIRPDGSDERKLFDDHCCPDWSPDGRLITPALTDTGLFTFATFDADGSNYAVMPNEDATLHLACDVWSPEGARVLCGGWDDSQPERNGVYTRRASDGGDVQLVTLVPDGARVAGGDYSPDGTQIVFLRNSAPDPEKNALFVVNTDGSGVEQITDWGMAGCCNASWSPDGKTILFDARDRLYLVQPDGSDLYEIPLPVEGGYSAYEPAWSPDGTHLVFSLYQFSGWDDLYIVRPDGSDLVQLTNDMEQEGQPEWGSYLP